MLKGKRLAAGDTPSVVLILQDKLLLLVNPSTIRMIDPSLLQCSGWLSVVEFLVLDTPEAWEFVEQLLTKRQCRTHSLNSQKIESDSPNYVYKQIFYA